MTAPDPTTVEAHQDAIAGEYGTYVAAEDIFIAGGRAFNAGDPVPVSHVDRGVVTAAQVHKITTKAGRAAAGLDETKG